MMDKEAIIKELDVQLETIAMINKQLDELLASLMEIQAMADNISCDLEAYKKGA